MSLGNKKEHTKNLTEGSSMKIIMAFVIPTFLGYLFQQFYNMADSIVVGRILGPDALAGVGSTNSVTFLVLGFSIGICTGFTIPVSQSFGKGDIAALKRYVGNIIWLTLGSALIITLLTTILCGSILHLMNNPEETFSYAYTYLFICFLGIPATMAYNLASSLMRALGDSRTPLLFLVFSSAVNIVLDIVLIIYTPLGVAGAALATVLSQFLSAVLSIVYMMKNLPVLKLEADDMKFRKAESKELLMSGVPMGLQCSVTAIGTMLIQSSINLLGPLYMAAFATGDKVHALLICPLNAIGTASATYTGQNVGAGKLKRVHKGMIACSILGLSYCVIALLLAIFCGEWLVSLFLDSQSGENIAEIVKYGHQYLIMNSSCLCFLLYVFMLRSSIQGMGFSNFAMFGGVLELISRSVIALLIVPVVGFFAVGFSAPAAWLFADLYFVPLYFICMKKLKKKQLKKAAE